METLNCAEVMRLLRVSRDTVVQMLENRELRGFRRGKVIRVDRRSLDRLLGRDEEASRPLPTAGAS